MAGYFNYSMSNNAVSAYNSGEKPFSKWSKVDILEFAQSFKDKDGFNEKFETLKNMLVADLKDNFLHKSSWHHTSKHYNKTNFFAIDELKFESYFETDVERKEKELKIKLLRKQREEEEQAKKLKYIADKETIKNLIEITDKDKLKGVIFLYHKEQLVKATVIGFDKNYIIIKTEEEKKIFDYEILMQNPERKTKFFELYYKKEEK